MSTRWDEFELKRKMLQEEYAVLALQWRFLQGVRIAIIIAVVTAQATLFATYRVLLISVAAGTARPFDAGVCVMFAVTGYLLAYITIIVEHNVTATIRGALRRGINLEDQCGITDGMYQHAVEMEFWAREYLDLNTIVQRSFDIVRLVWVSLALLALLTIFGLVS